jgi:WD40 repeat protein
MTLRGHDDALLSAFYSPDGKLILTASVDGTARLWDARSGTELDKLNVFELSSAEFSSDGRHILTTSKDQNISLWPIMDGHKSVTLRGPEGVINSVEFSKSGRLVVAVSMDSTARIWDFTTGQPVGVLRGHQGPVLNADFIDGNHIMTMGEDGTTRWWDVSEGRQVNILRGGLLSPDARHILALSDENMRLQDSKTGKFTTLLAGDGRRIKSVRFSPDGRRVLGRDDSDEAYLWDTATGRYIGKLRAIEKGGGRTQLAEFSPTGATVLTWTEEGPAAYLWDAGTGLKLPAELRVDDALRSAKFSPDGARIVTVSFQTARLWDAVTGDEIAELQGHEDAIASAHFSPDGTRLLTVSRDNTLRLWETADGKEIAVLRLQSGIGVQGTRFAPDGAHISIVFDDNTLQILWIGRTVDEMLKYARQTLPEDMTDADQRKFDLSKSRGEKREAPKSLDASQADRRHD